jgi:hypothetical protein
MPTKPVERLNGDAAIRRARAMALNEKDCGAVAFSRRGDPNVGEFDDAVILLVLGDVPEGFRGVA